jgi:hypothetical protein
MITLPFTADNKGTEMIGGKQQGKGKTYHRKPDKYIGVKIGSRYPADNPQGKQKHVYGTDTVYHGKDQKDLGYMGLLLPKFYELFHHLLLPR